jgi:hypothetical protein
VFLKRMRLGTTRSTLGVNSFIHDAGSVHHPGHFVNAVNHVRRNPVKKVTAPGTPEK